MRGIYALAGGPIKLLRRIFLHGICVQCIFPRVRWVFIYVIIKRIFFISKGHWNTISFLGRNRIIRGGQRGGSLGIAHRVRVIQD